MIILGAGMSGLLAANVFRKNKPVIFEKQQSLPNNHKALLRFRSDSVSISSGISFEKVMVRKQINYKGIQYKEASMKMSNEYTRKVSGEYSDRSIWNLDDCYRYIAPENFIDLLSIGVEVEYDKSANFETIDTFKDDGIISTIPMLDLMRILRWPDVPDFKYRSIWSVTIRVNDPACKVYQTTYYPNKNLPFYRASITGNVVIFEFTEEPKPEYYHKGNTLTLLDYCFHFLENDFGVSDVSSSNPVVGYQKYGKLIEIDSSIRKEFIHWATIKHNVYSLGRWATHRQILMDDVIKDISIISNLINSKNYNR